MFGNNYKVNMLKIFYQKPWLSKVLLVFVFMAMVSVLVPIDCNAEVNLTEPLKKSGQGIYGKEAVVYSLPTYVGVILRTVFSFIGVIMVVIVVYAGFLWLTAGGNQEQVKKAKSWITNGVIGMILVLSAFAITDYVFYRLYQATLQDKTN